MPTHLIPLTPPTPSLLILSLSGATQCSTRQNRSAATSMGAGAGEAPAPVAATNAPSVLLGKNRQWNTNNLGLRLCADGAAAATAGVLVAPVITMIDR